MATLEPTPTSYERSPAKRQGPQSDPTERCTPRPLIRQRYGARSLAAMLPLLLIINSLFLNASSSSMGRFSLG
jgi:hypothetical protein